MTQEEMKKEYMALYEYMANSKDPKNMKTFGRVMTTMIEDMIASNPNKADEYISRLESVKWKQYLTQSEADKIVASMEPKAPWTREQWNEAMQKNGFEVEEWPYYNRCALYVTMNMIMSDSSESIKKYIEEDHLFNFVHALALDKLKDKDGKFKIREYFNV